MPAMQIRLDPWPVDTLDGQLTLTPFSGELIDVETPRWAAIAPRPIPQRLERVYVVDGKQRMEARLHVTDDLGREGHAGFGAYVAGAVELCPHGSRQAELLEIRARRVLAHAPDLALSPLLLSPRHPQTGELAYALLATQPGGHPLAPMQAVQSAMLAHEQDLSHGLASAVPFDDTDDREHLRSLTIQDGTLRSRNLGGAVVGCVKTIQTLYLPTDRAGLLSELKPGERTPILHMRYDNNRVVRFIWYVRLCEAAFYHHPMSGVMRLEMYAPEDSDFLPPIVRQVASLSGELLCKLASKPHKDSRSPQNLIPTAALEAAMGRSMGSLELVTRRIRSHLARELGLDLNGEVA
jgi:uncharacterized protein